MNSVYCIQRVGIQPHANPSHLLMASFIGANPDPEVSGVEGGTPCAACTGVVALIEQLAYIHDEPILNVMDDFCAKFPPILSRTCEGFVDAYGQMIINLLELEETPDFVCQQIGVCTGTCSLFPPPLIEVREKSSKMDWKSQIKPFPEDWDPVSWINNFADYHNPLFDLDHDKFSDVYTFRGSSWRGRDCDDLRDKVYPGRYNSTYSDNVDHNCNGIYGHAENGTSFEELLCSGTPYYGTAILGDSAAAHFHIPPQYVTASQITPTTFDNILNILENEFDWPEMSATTGFTNNLWEGHPRGPVSSTYLKVLERNRCTFRDFQNIGVNGARTSSMASNIMYSFARNQEMDYPVNLMYALIGNDVCNPHPNFDHMTTPEEFYQNVVTATDYLDTQLPMDSNVIFMGLADGLILFNAMHDRIHPLGELRQDVTYENLYDYLNCLEISPCWGWLNSNATVRLETQRIANELSAVYQQVIAQNSYSHFNMTYIDCPVKEMVDVWESQGGEAWQLIEPVDGFHPNQIGNALIADYVWQEFENNLPYLIPPLNPHNDEIEQLFGDQGGY